MKKKKAVVICSSASFFEQALGVEKELKARGFKVMLPLTALIMKRSGDFRVKTYKTWLKDEKKYNKKTRLIKNHLKKITRGDVVLILNYRKNGVSGYIGGNTLIEIAIAFHYKKPIYILNQISDKLNFKEEIFGMQPIFIHGNLAKISL